MTVIPRFLIAKYVPDTRRMEPVNIGVVVWSKGKTACKFFATHETAAFVNDVKTYERWVLHWSKILEGDSIESREGKIVKKTSTKFLDEFLKSQKGNYVLTDGGEIMDTVNAKNIQDAVEFFFNELIARKGLNKPSPKEQAKQLRHLSKSVLREAGVVDHDEFKESYPVPCRFGEVQKTLLAHYAIGNGRPRSIFQRVAIGSVQSVYSASFMFEHMRSGGRLGKQNCAAIVYTDNDAESESEVGSSLAMLNEFATVVDLRQRDSAIDILASVARAA